MPRLTNGADHSKLWMGIAAVLGALGGLVGASRQRAGGASLAVTNLVTNQIAKRLWRRPRPDRHPDPSGAAWCW